MNFRILLFGVCVALSSARASLITVTPGAFVDSPPDAYALWLSNYSKFYTFFDEARIIPFTPPGGQPTNPNGFVGLYGALDGGPYFATDLHLNIPSTTSHVWWDFSNLGGYCLTNICVFGFTDNGDCYTNLYEVPYTDWIYSNGPQTVQLYGLSNIGGIAFYGRTPGIAVPDATSVPLLMAIAFLGLWFYRRK